MVDLFPSGLVCLALFSLITAVPESNRRGWQAGFIYVAVMVSGLGAGWLAGLGLVVAGSVIAGQFWQPQRRNRAQLMGVGRHVLIWGSVPAAAALVSVLAGVPIPLATIDSENLPLLVLVLVGGWGASLMVHWLVYRQWPSPHALVIEMAFVALTGVLLAVIVASAPAFYLAMVLLGVLAYHQWQAETLHRQLQCQQREAALLRQMGQLAGADFDLGTLLWSLYQHLGQFLDLSVFYVALYDGERDMLRFPLAVIDGQRVEWPERKPGTDPAAGVIRQNAPASISDRGGIALPAATASAYHQFLGVPVQIESEVAGVVAALNHSEVAYSPQNRETLQAIAHQVALAVHHTRLLTAQKEMADNLSQINDSVHQILFNSNRDSGLEAACKLAGRICDTGQIALFLVDDRSGELHLQTHIGLSEAYQTWTQTHPPTIPESPRVCADLPETNDLRRVGGFRAVAELPIRSDRLTQGLLAVYPREARLIHQREMDLLETLVNHVSAMLENVRLFGVMETYAYEMSELVQLSRISTSSLDIDGVVHDIADMLRQMTAVSRVAIFSLEGHRARLLAAVNSPDSATSGSSDELLESFAELTQLQQLPSPDRRAYQQNDEHLSPPMRAQMVAHHEQTVALVPLVVNMNVLGAVWLGSQETRIFEEREWQFIEMATNQIAGQIRNIQLHEQTQQELKRRLKQVSVIEEIARQVSSSLDFNVIIDHVLEAALNATGADMASLGLVNDGRDRFQVIEYRVQAGQPHKRHAIQPLQEGVMGQALRTREAVLVPDNQANPDYVTEYPGLYRSSLAVPLFKDDTVIGVLNVEAADPAAFNNEHCLFLVNLAGHAVISIENARVVRERQHEIDRLTNLRDLSLWLVSADDTRSVGYEILETALQLLDGQNAVLYEYDVSTGQLETLARLWYSKHEDTIADETLPHAVATQAATRKQVVVVEDVRQHPTWTEATPPNYQSVLAFPLWHFEQIQFVILMTKEERFVLAEQDSNTIDLLASQAIGHLENARLHERIRDGRDQMRAILNATLDGLILLDRTGHIIEANPSACHLIGIDFSEHIGQPFASAIQNATRDTIYTRQTIDDLLTTLRQQPESETRRAFHFYADQQTYYLQEIGLPVRDESERIVGRLLVLRDVTEARLLAEQREDLADMVVHDLRGPLGAIINAIDLVLPVLGSPEDLADTEQLLRGSIISANRLLTLVNTLLDISKMQHSGLELARQPVSLAAMVETAVLSMTALAEGAEIEVTVDVSADLPPVYVDQEKIERVLINLLDNGLRYTPQGGQIRIAAVAADGDWIETRIADSGPGIPPERRQHVFERFERIPGQTPRRGHRGHGLGLTFTRLAIEAHGGAIHVGDDDGLSGACFIFTLPIAK